MDVIDKNKQLIVSVSPHLRDDESVAKIMWSVSAALLPALLVGLYYFGLPALSVTAVCIAASMASEWLVQKMTGRQLTLGDGSAFLTGLLLGMNLPPSVPLYIPIVGAFVAIAITKQLFGGLGFNIFNPALIGRAFVLVSWPRAMTTWSTPVAGFAMNVDATTTATPLGLLKEEGLLELIAALGGTMSDVYMNLMIGNHGSSLGEASVAAILLGGVYLLLKRYITWHVPVSFLATVALVAWVFGGVNPETGKFAIFAGDPIIHLLSGGLMLGVFFMATDYVTVPHLKAGQLIFGVGCGLITMLIRIKGGFPEGVMFAILLMNCFTPLIDRAVKSTPFGLVKAKKDKA